MTLQVVVGSDDPLYGLGICQLLASLPMSLVIEQAGLERAMASQRPWLLLCLRDERQNRAFLDAASSDRLSGKRVVLFSSIFGERHRQLLKTGQIDDCLSLRIELPQAARRITTLLSLNGAEQAQPDRDSGEHFFPDPADLSRREQQVLGQLALGRTNQRIADELQIRLNTVKVHMATICRKHNYRNRTHAARCAYELKFG